MSNVHPSTVAATSDGRSYTYDANGNTLTGAGRTFTWNSDNRLEFLSAPGGSITSVYDQTGTRIKKTASGATTYYPFAGYEIDPSNVVTKYIRLGTEMLAAKKGGEKLFYHNDHQGGVNVITDIFAAVVQLNEYDPWGKVSRSEGSNAEPTKRFNGKELDTESGLYYYGGRYHDPDLARFVSADPFVQEPDNPQNFNRYSYTINNPQKYIDPSGHFFGFIFSLIFDRATAGKLTAASDPFSFLLSKIPRKANGAFNVLGGVAMLFTGNPAGVLYIASGAMSFGKGSGFQVASQMLGLLGAASTVVNGGASGHFGGSDPTGNRFDLFETMLAANAIGAAGSKPHSSSQKMQKQQLPTCAIHCYAHYIRGAFDPARPNVVQIPFSTLDTGVQPGDMPLFNLYAEVMQPGTTRIISPSEVFIQVDQGSYSSGSSTIGLTGTLSKDLNGNVSFQGYVSGVDELYNFNRPGWQNSIGRATPGRDFLIEWTGHRKVTYP